MFVLTGFLKCGSVNRVLHVGEGESGGSVRLQDCPLRPPPPPDSTQLISSDENLYPQKLLATNTKLIYWIHYTLFPFCNHIKSNGYSLVRESAWDDKSL